MASHSRERLDDLNTLWFIVPAHGRHRIAEICLRQLRRTCDALYARGIDASAIIVSDDENLELGRANGFATYEEPNGPLGRKINHGYQCAGHAGVEFMVPFGNDDWLDPDWITLPNDGETVATHWSTVVNEDCSKLSLLNIRFGDGVRVYPRSTLEKVGFRPARDDVSRAIDTATHYGINATGRPPKILWHDIQALSIVDFKSPENLNSYHGCLTNYGNHVQRDDVWDLLNQVYPVEAVREMQALHA